MKTTVMIATLCATLAAGPVFAGHAEGKSLPPGLQKKVERGGELPPGWQKKLARGEVLDPEVYRHSHRLEGYHEPVGQITVEVDGRIIRLIAATHEIVDILR